ncbi:MAG: YihY family inner membrane protein [Rubrivivax sp.]|nr:YihY family inner membrane protein [Rubrivivax sp.]MCA3258596.1 YihY family inner membrane protein [Rubrivivax sp.]MCE2913047.1 YihY family inner membrane protein [Rubrivivax sp.]MCZ8030171.1 YihY family inner membrane protein [Rubrivivax sp.]
MNSYDAQGAVQGWLGARIARTLERLLHRLRHWPWLDTARTLRQRFRDDQLSLTASSLTFTTLIALVPLLTVMLAVFSAFPMFAVFQDALEKLFLQSLVPENIARPVIKALTQFAGKARAIGAAGLVLLVVTALALMLTIDRTLNRIWRVRRPRPLAQRVLVYWAMLTLGPLALGLSLSVTSYALSASRGLVAALPGGIGFALGIVQFALLAAAMAGLFRFVPNAPVRWSHAWAGGLFVAIGFEGAKEALGWYLQAVPTYSVIYGAFATLPIFLLWLYLGWVIVLLGAVVAAYAPSLGMHVARQPATPGHLFELALALLGELHRARRAGEGGLTLTALAARLHTDPLQVDAALESLAAIDWVARLEEEGPDGEPRHALLCDPDAVPAKALIDGLLLAPGAASVGFRRRTRLDEMTLSELLP